MKKLLAAALFALVVPALALAAGEAKPADKSAKKSTVAADKADAGTAAPKKEEAKPAPKKDEAKPAPKK